MADKPTRLKRETVLTWFGGIQMAEAAHQEIIPIGAVTLLVPEDLD